MYITRQTGPVLCDKPAVCAMVSRARRAFRAVQTHKFSLAQKQGDEKMLGIIAAVLIVLWLLGFFAFHVTTAFIHAALIVGLILLVLHLVSGRTASA